MAVRERLRLSLRRIMFILVFWMLLAIVVPVHETLFLSNFPGIFESEYLADYGLKQSILAGVLSTLFAATAFGALEEFYFRKRLRRRGLGNIVVTKTVIYVVLMLIINVLGSFFYNSIAQSLAPWNPVVIAKVREYVLSAGFFNNILIYFQVAILTIFLLLVNDKFGRGMMWKFVRGKYHHPKMEFRAFMFIDIKGSTTLAEKLGHTLFFQMLNDFFEDVTDPILENYGQIYQYVGDEIVISWERKHLDDVVPMFFSILDLIEKKQNIYTSRYGEPIEFKAGVHLGDVTVGEIGVIKRDIAYSGDVLNTAARIQGMCNQFEEKLLVSEEFLSNVDLDPGIITKKVDDVVLRGKANSTGIYAITKA